MQRKRRKQTMPRFNKSKMKHTVNDLKTDVESGELTSPSWLWILAGGCLGLLVSCIDFTKKNTKPILAKFNRSNKHVGGNK